MDELQTGIIALIKSALTGEKAEISENFDWDNALNTAKEHQITPLIYYGVRYSGLEPSSEIMQFLELATYKNIAVSQNQLYALEGIYKAFDENRIDYMPLKGSVLKFVYPKPEMRAMGDADILVKQEQYDKIRAVMTELGFKEIRESDHELVWNKKGILYVELHKRLIPSYNKDYYAYYGNGWQLSKPCSDKASRFELTAEDQMIYLFTHFSKHYRNAGIGIRHLVDLWVYRQSQKNSDEAYIRRELEKLQLYSFYQNVVATLAVWFEGAKETEISEFITDFIFNSGVYGTHETRILAGTYRQSKSIENIKSIRIINTVKVVFLPYSHMKKKYPTLIKFPFLLPLFWIVRAFDVLLFKRKQISTQIEDFKATNGKNISDYGNALKFVGLDFNFKE